MQISYREAFLAKKPKTKQRGNWVNIKPGEWDSYIHGLIENYIVFDSRSYQEVRFYHDQHVRSSGENCYYNEDKKCIVSIEDLEIAKDKDAILDKIDELLDNGKVGEISRRHSGDHRVPYSKFYDL